MKSGTVAPPWQLGGPADAQTLPAADDRPVDRDSPLSFVVAKPAVRLTRATVLDAAAQACLKSRAATHGGLEDSFPQIAAIWSVRLGVPVTAAQVAIMMVDLKTVRAWGNPGHADNWVDIAGYAACGGELSGAVHDAE